MATKGKRKASAESSESIAQKMMDSAGQQPLEFKKIKTDEVSDLLTTAAGIPVGSSTACLTVGPRGPMLMKDDKYMEEIEDFVFSTVRPRILHAKGCGAFGTFEVTNDISKYCISAVFANVGKKTPIAVRFSMMNSDLGTPDGNRDIRGFAIRFYTEQGNWDLVGINQPVFFLRDPFLLASLSKSLKRNPVTNLKSPEAYWDFVAHRPETLHIALMNYSDRGTPFSYRHMHGFSVNTFEVIGNEGAITFIRFHWISNQGLRHLSKEEIKNMNADDPDFAGRDLYNTIAEGKSPSWTLNCQMMTEEQAKNFKEFDPFDCTKVWSHEEFPLVEIGKITLDKNPKNFYAEIEQLVFNPANLPPGINPSPDRILQGRMQIYRESGRHRVGVNFMQLPVNCPYRGHVSNYHHGGEMSFKYDDTGKPIYHPNSFGGPNPDPKYRELPIEISGMIDRYDVGALEDNYKQPQVFFEKVLDEKARVRLIANIAEHLQHSSPNIQKKMIEHFTKVHKDLGNGVKKELGKHLNESMTAPAE
ncbi:hypothetical protein QYM36_009993 [Artemia franciscana]|uniref:Catalase core domain-containing protein n=2 Tax=Artemia franciscana TaxID=6661 RepID=A0AA88HW01_ARTSF|nr:hypothetical protein QYM36_009993 [Artemia franciscana]